MNEIEQNTYLSVENIPNVIANDTILNIKTKSVNYLTHGFHKYPGKFIPQIPNWAINQYVPKDNMTILDPFCGSGTTLVEGLLNKKNAIGIDIDPLSVLISKVKTTPLNISKLLEINEWVIKNIKDNNSSNRYIPLLPTLNHWFSDDAIDKLGKIRFVINNILHHFPQEKDIQNFFYIAFSSIIRRASNADNQSQKTYVSHTKPKMPEEVYTLFFKQLDLYLKEIKSFSEKVNSDNNCDIFNNSSSTKISDLLSNKKINLVVTSPPYIKAIDYIYNQMVELFWIGDLFNIETQEKQNNLKVKYIGNKQIKKNEYVNFNPSENLTNIKHLDSILIEIINNDKKNGLKHSYITWKYFNEMDKHFKQLSSILNKKVHYIMVVGDSKVSDLEVDTVNILIDIAKKYNFRLSNKWGYKIKNRYMRFNRKGRGGKIEIDWVIDFEKE